jgi:hypothetical protein
MAPNDSSGSKRAPGRGPDAEAREAERKARLAAALRDNLRRRKARPATGSDPEKPQDGS